MQIELTLKQFLESQGQWERHLPKSQRKIPTIKELAKVANIQPNSLSRMLNNGKSIKLEVVSAIVAELRRRGVNVTVQDVFSIEEAQS